MKFIGLKAKLGHLTSMTSTIINLNPEYSAKVTVKLNIRIKII